MAALREHVAPDGTVAVIGASDGKFVLPLAAAGYRVIAIERDPLALYGGPIDVPHGDAAPVALLDRLRLDALYDRVTVVEADFLRAEPAHALCDAVWTSCSWHYSANHDRPLAEFVARMQFLVRDVGLFGAEYMMPVEPQHTGLEHYTTPERLSRQFADPWHVLPALRTDPFLERPHLGQPEEHTHRMGLLIAAHANQAPALGEKDV